MKKNFLVGFFIALSIFLFASNIFVAKASNSVDTTIRSFNKNNYNEEISNSLYDLFPIYTKISYNKFLRNVSTSVKVSCSGIELQSYSVIGTDIFNKDIDYKTLVTSSAGYEIKSSEAWGIGKKTAYTGHYIGVKTDKNVSEIGEDFSNLESYNNKDFSYIGIWIYK